MLRIGIGIAAGYFIGRPIAGFVLNRAVESGVITGESSATLALGAALAIDVTVGIIAYHIAGRL